MIEVTNLDMTFLQRKGYRLRIPEEVCLTMQSRQIILANEPRFLRSLFRRAFGKMPKLEVVGELTDLAGLPSMVDQTDAHWVMVSLSSEGKMPGIVDSLLAGYPSVGVVGLAADGSLVKIQRVGLPEGSSSTLSLDELVANFYRHQPILLGEGA
jgi:hypothetical protein